MPIRPVIRFAFLFVFSAGAAFAQLKVPPMAGWLNDTAGMVPANQREALEKRLVDFSEATGGGQFAVLTIPALEGEDIEGYALRVFEAWKPGRKDIDDGALLLLARDDRRSRLEIGYGWEGDINDARAGDILRNIAAYLAQDKTAEGITSAIGQIQRHITGSAPEDLPPVLEQEQSKPAPSSTDKKIELGIYIFIGLLFSIILGIGIFAEAPPSGSGSSSGSGGGYSSRRGGGGGYSGGRSSGGGGRSGGGGASGRW